MARRSRRSSSPSGACGGIGAPTSKPCISSVALYELARAGEWDKAMALQRKLWRVNQAFAKYALAPCIKAALEMQGFDVGAPIPPQAPLGDDERRDLRAILDDLGAL